MEGISGYLGALTSAAQTAGGIIGALKGKKPVVGTPAAAAQTASFNWKPWAIGGAAVLALGIVFSMLRRK